MEWRREQIAARTKVRPANFWSKVRGVKKKMRITAKMGRNWKIAFKKRHKLGIKCEKRCLKVGRQVLVERLLEFQFHTFMQAQQRFQNFKYTGSSD